MKTSCAAFGVGLLFALGLGVSGMTQVQKVVGFLDIFGHWQPALIFVMGGAIIVHFIAYRFIMKQKAPLFDSRWHLPTHKDISPSLIGGSLLFGIGWGLGGFCPGPAVVSLSSFQSRPWIFVVSMLAGMLVFRVASSFRRST